MSFAARLTGIFALSAVFAVSVACGSDAEDSNAGTSGGASSSGASGGAGSGGFGTSSGGASGSSGGDGSGDAGSCFAPVDMYIVFDKSGSMGEPAGNGKPGDCNIGQNVDSKWCRAINALSGYLKSPSAKDQSAALQFFSDKDNPNCKTGTPFDKPAIPTSSYTTLPSSAFDSALNGAVPGGGTPMEAALRGLVAYTGANRRGGHVTIGILVTDGNPQGCDEDLGNLSKIIEAHYAATKIRTYVIGMNGATFTNLEKIAAGGNAPEHPATVGALTNACGNVPAPCRFWNVGDGNPSGFIAALAAIQESADGCKPGGGSVNPVK